MKPEQAFYMNVEELQLVAAASGMKNAVFFQRTGGGDRVRQIQAVCRLVKDGFFIPTGSALEIGAELVPFVQVFRHAAHAVIAYPFGTQAPPLCIYYDETSRKSAVISPAASRDDTCKLCVVDEDELMEELEMLHFLPVPHDNSFALHELPADIRQLALEIAAETECEGAGQPAGEITGSRFERYSLSEKSCVQKCAVFQAASYWVVLTQSADGAQADCYSRSDFSDWLKGIER